MENLIKLHETAALIVWNVNKCRKYQRFAYESIQTAKQVRSISAEKDANESLALYRKCEDRFMSRYQKVINKIYETSL